MRPPFNKTECLPDGNTTLADYCAALTASSFRHEVDGLSIIIKTCPDDGPGYVGRLEPVMLYPHADSSELVEYTVCVRSENYTQAMMDRARRMSGRFVYDD